MVRRCRAAAADRRGLGGVPVVACRRLRHSARATRRAHSRDLPRAREHASLAAPRARADPRGDGDRVRRGVIARGLASQRKGHSGTHVLAPTAAVLGSRALRRAAAPLPCRVPARAAAGPHLRGFPARQRVGGADDPAIPRRRRQPPVADVGRKPVRAGALPARPRTAAHGRRRARARLANRQGDDQGGDSAADAPRAVEGGAAPLRVREARAT